MGQDSDVARVAAAMNAPGFKYRSFGNEPVRIRPGATGTLAQPVVEPVPYVEDAIPPPPMAMETVATLPTPQPFVGESLAYEDVPIQRYAYVEFAEPATVIQPLPEPAPPPEPVPPLEALPEPPLFSWPEAPANPMPSLPAAPALLPGIALAYSPAPRSDAVPLPGGGFRLLESIGHRPGESEVPRADSSSVGTLALLRRAAAGSSDAGGTTFAGIGMGLGSDAPLPPLSPTGHQSGLLPAAAVTVPLSDVMRLIAAGATPPPSPFDAFRAALGAQPGR